MNERINKLAKQARQIGEYVNYGQIRLSPEQFEQKFAELIVRDCMSICKQHPSRIVSNNWNADAVAPDIVHRFEEHFGVEE